MGTSELQPESQPESHQESHQESHLLSITGGPFLRDLGVDLISMKNGEAEIALTLEERHMNSWHVTHGGVTMTLLDVAMSMAGRSLDPQAKGGVTIEMKTSFLQPAGQPGTRIVARGRAFHRSTTMCFCDGEVWDGERLVARAMGTFKYIRRVRDKQET